MKLCWVRWATWSETGKIRNKLGSRHRQVGARSSGYGEKGIVIRSLSLYEAHGVVWGKARRLTRESLSI